MLVLKFVDGAVDAVAVSIGGAARGAIARHDISGCRAVRFDRSSAILACDHLAAARSRGRVGFLAALFARLRPDLRYSLVDGDTSMAQLRNVVRWGRGSHVEMILPDGVRWCVHGGGFWPRRLRLDRDGVRVGELRIEGAWRSQLRMPIFTELPPLVAVALGGVALQVWGNDPHAGDGGGE
jgi:hypothetical protein